MYEFISDELQAAEAVEWESNGTSASDTSILVVKLLFNVLVTVSHAYVNQNIAINLVI